MIVPALIAIAVFGEAPPAGPTEEPRLALLAVVGIAATPGLATSVGPELGAEVDIRLLDQAAVVIGGRHSFHWLDGAEANLTQAWLGAAYELDHTPLRLSLGAGFSGFRYAIPGAGAAWDWGAYFSMILSVRPTPGLSTGVELRYDSMQELGAFPGYFTLSLRIGWVGL